MTTKIRNLPCDISEEERRQRADRLVERLQTQRELEAEKKKATKEVGDKLKEVKGEIEILRDVLSTGKETREVEVEERIDLGRKCVDIIRADTGDRIDSRALREEDTQATLPFSSTAHPLEQDDSEEEADAVSRADEEKPATTTGKKSKRRRANVPRAED